MLPVAPRSFAGYLQSKGTSQGFQRMRQRGIVLPPFQVEQMAAKVVRTQIEKMIAGWRKALILEATSTGLGVKDALPELTSESVERMRARLAELNAAAELSEDETRIRIQLSRQLAEAQEHFFADFFEDASERLKTHVAYALTKDDVFRDRLDTIRAGYLDSAAERIYQGKSDLRKKFIGIFEQWINGERQDLEGLDDLMGLISKEGGNFSRFFARDQFSRFNKALMVASYQDAGAKWIRWVTVGDARVRLSHRRLLGKIFAIDDLPKEYAEPNCRCGFLAVFELTSRMVVTPGDGIRLAA